MKWRPMKTAPRDGTPVLLLIEGVAIEAAWDETPWRGRDAGEWVVATVSSHGCGCCSSSNDEPTHWMRLVKPEGASK